MTISADKAILPLLRHLKSRTHVEFRGFRVCLKIDLCLQIRLFIPSELCYTYAIVRTTR